MEAAMMSASVVVSVCVCGVWSGYGGEEERRAEAAGRVAFEVGAQAEQNIGLCVGM